jgi:hypothetical protein
MQVKDKKLDRQAISRKNMFLAKKKKKVWRPPQHMASLVGSTDIWEWGFCRYQLSFQGKHPITFPTSG